MKILSAKDGEGNFLTLEQQAADAEQLRKSHEQARKEDPMWEFFGGTISVNGHEYQVA